MWSVVPFFKVYHMLQCLKPHLLASPDAPRIHAAHLNLFCWQCYWLGAQYLSRKGEWLLILNCHDISTNCNIKELLNNDSPIAVSLNLYMKLLGWYKLPIAHWVSCLCKAIDTLFPLLLQARLETWAKGFYIKPLEVHDLCHAHSLASLQWSGLSDQWMLLPEKCLQCQKWSLYKSRGAFLHPFMLKRREMAQLLPTKAFLQPAKTAAMCMASPVYAHPPPPILLVLNLSWKWIAPTDNMVSWWVHPSSVVKGVVECLAIHVVPFPSTFCFPLSKFEDNVY